MVPAKSVPSRSSAALAAALAAAALAFGSSACARTAEERQLDEMRAEIDRIEETRDRADGAERSALAAEVADSHTSTVTAAVAAGVPVDAKDPSAASVPSRPSDQDVVTLGMGPGGGADEYADTEDPSPRPSIRVLGSSRPNSRGAWRDDQVEQTSTDDPNTTSAPGARPGTLDPQAKPAYDAAMSLMNARQYDRALDAFAAFLVKWPEHPYAVNAMYWRGEAYFARGEFLRASEQFEGTVARFPAGNKSPDALLKLGFCQQKLGDPVKAKETFDRLAQLYPQSEASRRIPPVTVPTATPRGPASEDHR